LKSLDNVSKVYPFTRKDIPTDAKVTPIIAKDTAEWTEKFPSGASILLSALGTTRANAGGLEQQRKVDYDLNVAMAQAAKAAGVRVYVLISSSGANSKSSIPYTKMKGEIEEAVTAIDFEHVVILRPGLIVGQRNESRLAEGIFRNIAMAAGAISGDRLKDFWAQDDVVIARAAVRAGLDCLEGQQKEKFMLLGQSDIVRLGKTEWKH